MSRLYPLRLKPILRRYLWGGRRFQTVFGRDLGPGDDYAESWEVCDHGSDQTTVVAGPLAGTTLHELVAASPEEFLGPSFGERGQGASEVRFPLLLKLLDAQQRLSVQVHPNDAQAAQADPPDLGKTEAWIVLAAEPQAAIYAGLKPGVDRATLAEAVREGRCAECLHRFYPQVGDCVFIPAGTVHALGEGLVIYEVQQSSNLTYRLFDWNRVGADGKPRALHLAQALDVIDYARGPVGPQTPQAFGPECRKRLVTSDPFTLDRWELAGPTSLGGDGLCHLLTVIDGELELAGDPAGPLRVGQTVVLPAACGAVLASPQPRVIVLDACPRR